MDRERIEYIGKEIIDAAYKVHNELGPGLLESAYESCLVVELLDKGLKIARQVKVPILYKDLIIDEGYRLDLLIEGEIVIELKSVKKILPVHEAQILSYLKLTNKRLGFLINFNVSLIKLGIIRKVNYP